MTTGNNTGKLRVLANDLRDQKESGGSALEAG
jgi:hypothetical protein